MFLKAENLIFNVKSFIAGVFAIMEEDLSFGGASIISQKEIFRE